VLFSEPSSLHLPSLNFFVIAPQTNIPVQKNRSKSDAIAKLIDSIESFRLEGVILSGKIPL
jgi:hypothetical protein